MFLALTTTDNVRIFVNPHNIASIVASAVVPFANVEGGERTIHVGHTQVHLTSGLTYSVLESADNVHHAALKALSGSSW